MGSFVVTHSIAPLGAHVRSDHRKGLVGSFVATHSIAPPGILTLLAFFYTFLYFFLNTPSSPIVVVAIIDGMVAESRPLMISL
jgi:hypothetical protein